MGEMELGVGLGDSASVKAEGDVVGCWATCLSPKGDQNSCEIGYGEIVLTLCSERFPDPLVIMSFDLLRP